MVRLDSIALENNVNQLEVVTFGVCATTMKKNDPILCLEAEAIEKSFLAIKKCSTLVTSSSINFSFNGTNLAWSPNLHLRLRQLWLESRDFRSIVFNDNIVNVIKEKSESKKHLGIVATNGIFFYVDISPRHYLQLSSENLEWSQGEWVLSDLQASLNGAKIIDIEGFKLIRVLDSEDVRSERLINEGFELQWNETWELNITLAKACFPYEHQFCEAIQNELFSIRRWLKELHSTGAKTNKLPCDLVIKVRRLIY